MTNDQRSTAYKKKQMGFDSRVGYPIFEYTQLFLTYKLESTRLTDVKDITVNEDEENGIASSVRTSLVRDIRDNKFEPTKGYYLSLATEYAGVGGDKKWYKNELDTRYFYNIIGNLVLRTRLYAGKVDRVGSKTVPRTEKFTLGGPRNLRGYNYEAIGDRAEATVKETGKKISFIKGGDFSSFTTFEFEHPLAQEAGLKWVLFYDAGYAGRHQEFKLYSDYGFGFRWFSPIGVLRFEFGYPVNPSPENQGSKFHFDIGQLF